MAITQSLKFKLVYTTNVKNYFVDKDWSLTEFIDTITNKVKNDMSNIDVNDNIDIIESYKGENGLAIQRSNIKIHEKYGVSLQNLSFYIRPLRLVNQLRETNLLERNVILARERAELRQREIEQSRQRERELQRQMEREFNAQRQRRIQEEHIYFNELQIRQLQTIQTQLQTQLQRQPEIQTENLVKIMCNEGEELECPICYELSVSFYAIANCSHKLCTACYIHCYNTNNILCPICRNGRIVNCS